MLTFGGAISRRRAQVVPTPLPTAPVDAGGQTWHRNRMAEQRPPAHWIDLRRFTPARVALGRAGNGLPTSAHLDFQAAHAAARDAVHAELDVAALCADLTALGSPILLCTARRPIAVAICCVPTLAVACVRQTAPAFASTPGAFLFVICDGLSATAVQAHAVTLLRHAMAMLGGAMAPIVVAQQGRVALGDDIGEAMSAEAVAVLIGERPGLSAADSLGVYLTWQPRRGRTDAERNCISNVRPEGLPPVAAAAKLVWLINAMRRLRLTGVNLKDEHTQQSRIDAPRNVA